MATLTALTWAENYELLVSCAAKIRSSQVTDIDQLVDWVQMATEAHKNCKARLEAIASLLEPLEDVEDDADTDGDDDNSANDSGAF